MTEKLSAILGDVPKTWEVALLEDIVTFITKGGTPTTYGHAWASEADGVPFFRSECVTDAGLLEKGMNYISEAAHQLMQRSEVRSGDLLMTITGNIGRVARVPKKFKRANINQHIARIRVDSKANTTYIYQALKHEGYAKHYASILTGQAYPQISLQQVRETPVALPLLLEQQKIAAILTAVDDKLDVIARQISATQTLKQGLMQTLFSRGAGIPDAQGRWHPHTEFQETELGRIPVGWMFCRTREICDVRDGTHESPKFHERGIPLYTSKNISDGCLTSDGAKFISFEDAEQVNKRSAVHLGDIIMSMIGTVGAVALVDREPDFCIKNVGLFKPNKERVSSSYLALFFQSPAFKIFIKTQLDGGIQKFLSLSALRDLVVPMPPRYEQEKIASILNSVDEKIATLTTKQTHYQSLKRGLMQKLLTGQWRVRLD